jgi:hypothetical protein
MTTHNPHPLWIGRVLNFTKQMFPLYPNVVIFIVQFIVNYMMINKFFPPKGISLTNTCSDLLFGSISLVLFVYLFRCFDEVKDYPTDKMNFPDRPLVAGVLSLKDIKILQVVVILILLAINAQFFHRDVGISFTIIMLFTMAASQWFFCEKKIRPSLPLALYTHNPILYLYQIYILSFFTLDLDHSACAAILFLLGDALPGTAWELSRKIRGKKEEDTYTTYSMIWGPYIPTVLVALFTLGGWILSFIACSKIFPQWVLAFWIPSGLVWLAYIGQVAKYWKNPDVAPPFRQYVEVIKLLLMFAFIGALVFGKTYGQ